MGGTKSWHGPSLLAGLFAFLPNAHAQAPAATAYQPPHTADGHPDLQGVWAGDFITQLERPDGFSTLIVEPDKAAELAKKLTTTPDGVYDPDNDYFRNSKLLMVDGTLRSSWLVEPTDGQMPYTALAKAAFDRDETLSETSFDNPEERPSAERCVSGLGHPPIHGISIVIPYQIIQTPDAILVVAEDTDAGRIIHLRGDPPPDAIRSRAGYSAGRWEGDTLVVETTHLAADDPSGALYRDAIALSEGSRVIERFTLQSDSELRYQFSVVDPALYDRPWLAEYSFSRLDDRVYEYACHEGNFAMPSILRAGRMGLQKLPKKTK